MRRYSPPFSEVNGELNLAILGDRLLRDILKKSEDLLVNTIAMRGPFYRSKKNTGAFPQLRKMEFLSASGMKIINLLLQLLVENKLKPIPSFLGGAGNGQGDGRSEWLQVVSDGIAPNTPQHSLHARKEVLKREHSPRALVLEVVENAVPDIINEWKI